MKVLKFNLSGASGFFKKSDVNVRINFTYGHIHKIALLGLLGAIIGCEGYQQQKEYNNKIKGKNKDRDEYPGFYDAFQNLKIAIVPKNKEGFIPKKIQIFNNSVGYASRENGCNLVIRQQWLENPSWDIYFIIDSDISEKLANYLLDYRAKFLIYLGANNHQADIKNIKLYDNIEEVKNCNHIDSLCMKDFIEIKKDDKLNNFNFDFDNEEFKYEEFLPVALTKETNMHQVVKFIYTNMNISVSNECKIYNVDNKNLFFY